MAACAIAWFAAQVPGQVHATPVFDTVIEHGRVVDGTGSPWFRADVGIRAGRIAAIGSLGDLPARQRIEARGLVVAPGFIDMLGQSELTLLVNPHVPSKLYQGITTEITLRSCGPCRVSRSRQLPGRAAGSRLKRCSIS